MLQRRLTFGSANVAHHDHLIEHDGGPITRSGDILARGVQTRRRFDEPGDHRRLQQREFAGRAIDLCNAGDPICSDGSSVPAHRAYDGSTAQAAAFVASLL